MNSLTLSPEERKARRKAQLKAANATYYNANRKKIAIGAANYYKANQEKVRARQSAYYKANREKCVAYAAARRAANPGGSTAYHMSQRQTKNLLQVLMIGELLPIKNTNNENTATNSDGLGISVH